MNELLRVPFDFCVPTVKVEIEKVQCIDFKGRENHVLLMHIEPSMEVHANQADEVFMRVGNKSKIYCSNRLFQDSNGIFEGK